MGVSIGPSDQLVPPLQTEVVFKKISRNKLIPGTEIRGKRLKNVEKYHF